MSINNEFNCVKEFHVAFNHPVKETPTFIDNERVKARSDWMKEEINEFIEATDVIDQADAMIDLIYFALGTMVEMGVEPAKLFEIVQNANMSKLWEDGKPHYREDGKIIKPDTWKNPYPKLKKCIENMKK